MDDKVARHKQICDELNKLYERKNHDYGDSFHQTFEEEGLAMARIRLGDKLNRFKTLSKLPPIMSGEARAMSQKVTDESMRDTLLDLANYAIMTVMEIDGDMEVKKMTPEVIVTGGELSQEEINRYIDHARMRTEGAIVKKLEIRVDGEYVDLKWYLGPQPFERIRRITGYLVGDMSRWNNAKTAEERDRVKHI